MEFCYFDLNTTITINEVNGYFVKWVYKLTWSQLGKTIMLK
jgi:hypothetical protein